MPFKPSELDQLEKEPKDRRPVFRIGETGAHSTEQGGAGSMAIPVAPSVTKVTRFRIAGLLNEGVMSVKLYRCGWDHHKKTSKKDAIVDKTLEPASPVGPFEYTTELDAKLDPEYHALSLVIEVTKKTKINLIAVEFGY